MSTSLKRYWGRICVEAVDIFGNIGVSHCGWDVLGAVWGWWLFPCRRTLKICLPSWKRTRISYLTPGCGVEGTYVVRFLREELLIVCRPHVDAVSVVQMLWRERRGLAFQHSSYKSSLHIRDKQANMTQKYKF